MSAVRSSLLMLAALAFGACGFSDVVGTGLVNECTSDEACSSGRCDPDEGFCISARSEAVEVVLEVVPPVELSDVPVPSWSVPPEIFDGEAERVLRQPTHVDLVGTIRWRGMRVPAELVFTRPGLEGRSVVRVRASTFAEPMLVADQQVDFRVRLGTDRDYDLEVRPSAEPVPGTDLPWSRKLPPMRVRGISTPMASPLNPTNYVWPFELMYPDDLDEPCVTGRPSGCTLSGAVVSLVTDVERIEPGLQVQAIEVDSGLVVSSTALTDEEGAFTMIVAPSAGRYVLRVTGGTSRPLFPTVTVDPSFFLGSARIRVPSPRQVSYRASVETTSGQRLPRAVVTFVSRDVFDAETGLAGTFRATAETDATGEVLLDLLAGTYEAVVTPADGAHAVVALDGLRIQPPVTGGVLQGQLFVVPERARFGGSLFTPSGEPVVGLTVEAVALGAAADPGELGSVARHNRSTEALLDETGRFELRLDVGTYDVFIKPPPESRYPWLVAPARQIGSTDLVLADRFDLEAPRPLRGEVVTPEGAPLANAEVRAFGRAAGTGRYLELGRARTDAEGRYLLLLPTRVTR
ncbi:MAG: carboxypeptidase regulatory-like domain-containing protein [Myxococcales bacterium]|nr:carboxypeptidase regulatory-like domain-containing protein [Myxococcales bacterium]